MDSKLYIIGGVVVALVLGGLGWVVTHQTTPPPPVTAVVPAAQLQNERPATATTGGIADTAPTGHSRE